LENIDISIIIVSYNTKDLLYNCIQSIYEHTKNITFEIIISDNGSSDGTSNMIEQSFPEVTFIDNKKNWGFGIANNIGAYFARGEFLFLLNSDTVLLNNAVLFLMEFLKNNPHTGACGGNLFDENLRPIHSFRRSLPSLFWEINAIFFDYPEKILYKNNIEFNHTDKPMRVAYITGADLMIRRKVWNTINGFSPEFFMYYEDAELSFRIKKIGYSIYNVPKANIIHFSGKSSLIKEKQELYFLQSKKIYFLKIYSKYYYNMICFFSNTNLIIRYFADLIRRKTEGIKFWREKRRIWKLYKSQKT
jgi:GT2 family glycosyltransferase